jgi:hypothetical protein
MIASEGSGPPSYNCNRPTVPATTDLTWPMSKKHETSPFLTFDESLEWCKKFATVANQDYLHSLTGAYVLPVFRRGSNELILAEDLKSTLGSISLSNAREAPLRGGDLFHRGLPTKIIFGGDTEVDLPPQTRKCLRRSILVSAI